MWKKEDKANKGKCGKILLDVKCKTLDIMCPSSNPVSASTPHRGAARTQGGRMWCLNVTARRLATDTQSETGGFMWQVFLLTSVKVWDKLLLKAAVCCIYLIMIVDGANMQTRSQSLLWTVWAVWDDKQHKPRILFTRSTKLVQGTNLCAKSLNKTLFPSSVLKTSIFKPSAAVSAYLVVLVALRYNQA